MFDVEDGTLDKLCTNIIQNTDNLIRFRKAKDIYHIRNGQASVR